MVRQRLLKVAKHQRDIRLAPVSKHLINRLRWPDIAWRRNKQSDTRPVALA
jgi:hypothetical protein